MGLRDSVNEEHHTLAELRLNDAALQGWVFAASNKPDEDMAFATKCLRKIINTELTETQRKYLLEYYLDGKTGKQIALEAGLNPSTITRSLQLSKRIIADRLQYVSPRFMKMLGRSFKEVERE